MTRKGGAWYWLALLVLLGLTAVYVSQRDLEGLYLQYRQSGQQVEVLRQKADALNEKEARLKERVDHLESDPIEMEAAIRQRKNLVRPGETVYRVELADD